LNIEIAGIASIILGVAALAYLLFSIWWTQQAPPSARLCQLQVQFATDPREQSFVGHIIDLRVVEPLLPFGVGPRLPPPVGAPPRSSGSSPCPTSLNNRTDLRIKQPHATELGSKAARGISFLADDRDYAKKEKSRPEAASFWLFLLLTFHGVSGLPRCILHVARDIVGGTLGLIELSFGFHFLVTGELTGTFLDGTFGFVGSALHVFAIHDRAPYSWDQGQRNGCATVPRNG
jgi:hypothetical protein